MSEPANLTSVFGKPFKIDLDRTISLDQEWLAQFVNKRIEIELEKANLQYLREYAESFANLQNQIDAINTRLTKEVSRQDRDHNSLWERQSEKEKALTKLSALVDSVKHQKPSDIPLHQIDEMIKNIRELYELQQIGAINASAYREKVNYLQEETRVLDAWCDKNSIRIEAIEKKQGEIENQTIDACHELGKTIEDLRGDFDSLAPMYEDWLEKKDAIYQHVFGLPKEIDEPNSISTEIKDIAQAIRELAKAADCDVNTKWFTNNEIEIIKRHISANHNNDWGAVRGIAPRELKVILNKIEKIQSC